MVKEAKKGRIRLYICEEYGLAYKEKTWAEKCERFWL